MWSCLLLGAALAEDPPPAAPPPADPPPSEPAPAPKPGSRTLGTFQLAPSLRGTGGELSEGMGMLLGGTYGTLVGGATVWAARGSGGSGQVLAGGALGGVAGGLVGLTVARGTPTTEGQAALVGSSAIYGAFLGLEAGRALIPPDDPAADQRVVGASLLGSLGGLGVGALIARPDARMEDVAAVDLAAGAGWVASWGLNDAIGAPLPEERAGRALLGVGLSTATGGLGYALARAGVAPPDPLSAGLGALQGGWIGLWAPAIATSELSGAGLRIGLGAGYLASYGLARLGEPGVASAALQLGGGTFGALLGAGLPWLILGGTERRGLVLGPMLAGGLAGQIGGALIAPDYPLDEGAVLVGGALGGLSGLQGVGWGYVVQQTAREEDRGVALGMAMVGAGGLATMVAAPRIALSREAATLLFTAGSWGTALGALGAAPYADDPATRVGVGLGVGDAALLGVGAALGGGWAPSWGTALRVNGGLALGGAVGALGAVVFAYDPEDPSAIELATVGGALVGLGVGLALPHHEAPVAAWTPHAPRLRRPVRAQLSVAPWTAEDGSQGAWVSVQGPITR